MTPCRTLAPAVVVEGSLSVTTGASEPKDAVMPSSVLCHEHRVSAAQPLSREPDQGMSPVVPTSFSALVSGRDPAPYISGDAWLSRLPVLVQESLARWEVTPDGNPMHGMTALVVPVRRGDGSAAVLKLTWPHLEARHEPVSYTHLTLPT